MPDYQDQIEALEEELRNTKYNKRTQHHVGLVKAKIAKLRERQEARGGGGKGEGFSVKKSGNATVALLGFPSVGKSTLLGALTNAESKVGAYAFTTVTVVPGMMEHKGARIQILDLPGIISGASRGAGRGKEVISTLRQADLILIVLEPSGARDQYSVLRREIHNAGVRFNTHEPDVKITKDSKGGITIYKTVELETPDETLEAILREFRIPNATTVIRDRIGVDEFIDVIEGNKAYVDGLVVVNKADLASTEELDAIAKDLSPDLFISAQSRMNIEELKDMIYKKINFYRIYLKEVGKKPDMDEPLIIRGPCTVKDVCDRLHRDFVDKFKFAKVWGKSVKFPSQKVSIEHELADGDVLEIHTS